MLVKGSVDWADEFNCEFFGVFSNDAWEKRKKTVEVSFEENEGEREIGFGTNEDLRVDSYDNWINQLEVTPITEEEAKVLHKLFNEHNKRIKHCFSYGTGSGFLEAGCDQF